MGCLFFAEEEESHRREADRKRQLAVRMERLLWEFGEMGNDQEGQRQITTSPHNPEPSQPRDDRRRVDQPLNETPSRTVAVASPSKDPQSTTQRYANQKPDEGKKSMRGYRQRIEKRLKAQAIEAERGRREAREDMAKAAEEKRQRQLSLERKAVEEENRQRLLALERKAAEEEYREWVVQRKKQEAYQTAEAIVGLIMNKVEEDLADRPFRLDHPGGMVSGTVQRKWCRRCGFRGHEEYRCPNPARGRR